MSTVWSVVYGSRSDADVALARVKAMHERVRGTLAGDQGPFRAGTPYAASDPELLWWVHATLIDTALLVYGSWVKPLSPEELAGYYRDMKRMAHLFDIPNDVMPSDYGEFRDWMSATIAGEEICVTEVARRTAETILRPPLPLPLRPAMEAFNLVTTSLLPAKLRDEYGLAWDPARAAMLTVSRQWIKRVALPLMPDIVRAVGAAREAEGQRPLPLGRLVPALAA
jgi:uncharacterized protein (DUF2236 family)